MWCLEALRLAWLRAQRAAHRSTVRRFRDLQPADKHTSKHTSKPLKRLKTNTPFCSLKSREHFEMLSIRLGQNRNTMYVSWTFIIFR